MRRAKASGQRYIRAVLLHPLMWSSLCAFTAVQSLEHRVAAGAWCIKVGGGAIARQRACFARLPLPLVSKAGSTPDKSVDKEVSNYHLR